MVNIKLFAIKVKEQTVRIYSQDIGMEFGIEKCANQVMKRGKRHMTEGVELTNQEKTQDVRGKNKPTNIWKYWKLTHSN